MLEFELIVIFIVVPILLIGGMIVIPAQENAEYKNKIKQSKNSGEQKNKKSQKYQDDSIGNSVLDKFFVECTLLGYDDFSVESNVARAKLLADKHGLQYPDGIERLYEQGLQEHKSISDAMAKIEFDELKEQEKILCDELNRYADLYGKAKPIAILRDEKKRYEEVSKKYDNMSDVVTKNYSYNLKQREGDWAIMGGIADALAGPGAGVATAMDIQSRNAQIRASNQQAFEYSVLLLDQVQQQRFNELNKMVSPEEVENEISKINEKLLADTAADEVLKLLEITDEIVTVSDTGAFIVTANVKLKKNAYIYGDVPAVADGTLVAHVFEDYTEIGKVNMVIPYKGVNSSEHSVKIQGMGLTGAHGYKKQTVKFTAEKLWLIEKFA